MKKVVKFVWKVEGKKRFQDIKDAIAKAPVQVSQDYSKDFMVFSFASEDTIAYVVLQKNKDGNEQPIAFMSRLLQSSKLNYCTTEKQDCALVKSLKHSRTYGLF